MASILLIDDDPQIREALAGCMSLDGHQVHLAENGRAGLEIIRTVAVDVVITDIIMPEQDGFEVIMSLGARLQPPKIIAITGGSAYLDHEMLLKIASNMKVNKVLQKPVRFEEISKAIAEVLGG
ncbi:response regulator [Geobacter sp. DSM 9736]|uniref:response regulator n=1 Tax=Geobacter sp. DSM 9736 TaxID=1277350 RepID=UPI000B5022B8|nr:response regulator [Geobacter sp. DSM 9736]SNB44754.1 Response regulator receiver domain-containing protein [Geobacter sp. DSM 9736]